ncbi:MAG: SGNH/GDSL hydrolase family protein [Clostridia bacterium]|nr:SGNH/GDSL hydrolase family protein [Clostridia bacterium]
MKTILFQGDSITDTNRVREREENIGAGYALLVSAELGYLYPNQYKFVNKGISGNQIVDLYARMKTDILNIKPDYMSILIGVNDVWHGFTNDNAVDAEKFHKVYSMLIEEVIEELPDTKIMLLEPYVLEDYVTSVDGIWETFKEEVALRAKKAREIADKYNLVFVPLQEEFDKASKEHGVRYFTYDGVHPTPFGHELIKRQWLKGFNKLIEGEK